MNPLHIIVLFPEDGEALAAFERRIAAGNEQSRIAGEQGEIVLILSVLEEVLLQDKKALTAFLDSCRPFSGRLRLALRKKDIITAARSRGIRVIERAADLKKVLDGHSQLNEALREYSPQIFRQQLRSRLQSLGLLSLPKLRIWALVLVSAILFFVVFFRLLPSAKIIVWPREDTISQTVNIFLVQSGAMAAIPPRVRAMDLHPIVVESKRTLTFDQISKEFIGTNAKVAMTLINNSLETYPLRKGTRLLNQAGMIFRLQESVILEPGEDVLTMAIADDLDLYGEIIGKRGNVRAGIRWDLPGLSREERMVVYGENKVEATSGTTDYRTVLSTDDLDIAKKKLEQELLAIAKQMVDEERDLHNSEHDGEILELLYYEELTKVEYRDFVLPEQFLGEPVTSVPLEGTIKYVAYSYDTQYVLDLLSKELRTHVGSDKRLLEHTLNLDRLVAHVIDYEDDFSWIKLTVDLSGTRQYILDPLSPTGARFARKIRESVVGLSRKEAQRIINNFPEVEKAEVSLWPPWTLTLPTIPSHLVINAISGE